VFAVVVIFGLGGAVILSVVAGSTAGPLPGVALGSGALLLAERAGALFAIWMLIAVVVIRALRNQIPVEISGRGVRYAEAENVQATTASGERALRRIDGEMSWLRDTVLELRDAEHVRRRGEGANDG
jgi:hypothetical protein